MAQGIFIEEKRTSELFSTVVENRLRRKYILVAVWDLVGISKFFVLAIQRLYNEILVSFSIFFFSLFLKCYLAENKLVHLVI